MTKSIFITLFIACVINSSAQIQPAKQKGFSDEEYNFVSEMHCSSEKPSDRVFVFHAETLPQTDFLDPHFLRRSRGLIGEIRDYYSNAKLPDATDDLIKDYLEKNDRSYLLERKFSRNYVLLTKKELKKHYDKARDPDSWKWFKATYPKSTALERFSRIGFSPNRKQAFMFHADNCGWGCPLGNYRFFVKEGDKWIEKATAEIVSTT